jgi:hypothetical protein
VPVWPGAKHLDRRARPVRGAGDRREQLIITQTAQAAHANPDTAARQRADRLSRATVDQMQNALAFLGVIDPGAFEIAAALRAAPHRPRRVAAAFEH